MGKAVIMCAGGGGLDTDELTALAGDVIKGKTAGVKGSDDPVAGTLELTGSAADSQVLAGQTYYNTDAKGKRSGTMPNNGAQNATLNCGQSKAIPAGYTTGGTVTANSLASQTGGVTADDAKVLSGYTYWRDGVKRTGNLAVQSVINFSVAQYSNLTLICTWANPSRGPWSGLRIICKQGSYPSNPWDGTFFYEGSSTYCTNSLPEGTWYFRAWNYINTSVGVMYGGWHDATVWNGRIQGQQVFVSSTVFTVLAAVRNIDIFCVGGGSSGATSAYFSSNNYCGGGGGGSGYTATAKNINVAPGDQLSIVIGSGGTSDGINVKQASKPGSATYVLKSGTNLCNADGGKVGKASAPSSGGSGGGCGGQKGGLAWSKGRAGGSDGNGGEENIFAGTPYPGKGQGSTTRAFSESSNTLYAGGGGGACLYNSDDINQAGGDGGAGGGGKGGNFRSWNGVNGSANTGSGGGGSFQDGLDHGATGSGAAGICIIRWGY